MLHASLKFIEKNFEDLTAEILFNLKNKLYDMYDGWVSTLHQSSGYDR